MAPSSATRGAGVHRASAAVSPDCFWSWSGRRRANRSEQADSTRRSLAGASEQEAQRSSAPRLNGSCRAMSRRSPARTGVFPHRRRLPTHLGAVIVRGTSRQSRRRAKTVCRSCRQNCSCAAWPGADRRGGFACARAIRRVTKGSKRVGASWETAAWVGSLALFVLCDWHRPLCKLLQRHAASLQGTHDANAPRRVPADHAAAGYGRSEQWLSSSVPLRLAITTLAQVAYARGRS